MRPRRTRRLARRLSRAPSLIVFDETDAALLGTAIRHETSAPPATTYREPPPDDAQLMFFVPTAHDAPLKDDINLMDIAPFSLSKTVREGVIRYELKDALITIEGGAEVGLVTAYDYDIFIFLVSQLAYQMKEYEIAVKRGLRPSLPPRVYRANASEILKFCRIDRGGRQYTQLEASLDRLQATRYKITNLTHNNTRRAHEAFPLIGRYKVVSRTAIREILARIANAEAGWRKMLAIVRATPVVPDTRAPRHAINGPDDLLPWNNRLAEWARPENEIIEDLKLCIARQEPRSDEALDHVEWTAEDDIEAIEAVLRRAETWPLSADARAYLTRMSEEARAQLTALIALVNEARPFSAAMQSAKVMAEMATASGQKPN